MEYLMRIDLFFLFFHLLPAVFIALDTHIHTQLVVGIWCNSVTTPFHYVNHWTILAWSRKCDELCCMQRSCSKTTVRKAAFHAL